MFAWLSRWFLQTVIAGQMKKNGLLRGGLWINLHFRFVSGPPLRSILSCLLYLCSIPLGQRFADLCHSCRGITKPSSIPPGGAPVYCIFCNSYSNLHVKSYFWIWKSKLAPWWVCWAPGVLSFFVSLSSKSKSLSPGWSESVTLATYWFLYMPDGLPGWGSQHGLMPAIAWNAVITYSVLGTARLPCEPGPVHIQPEVARTGSTTYPSGPLLSKVILAGGRRIYHVFPDNCSWSPTFLIEWVPGCEVILGDIPWQQPVWGLASWWCAAPACGPFLVKTDTYPLWGKVSDPGSLSPHGWLIFLKVYTLSMLCLSFPGFQQGQ